MKHTDDIDAEVRSHLAHRADDLERTGLPRAEAERQARLEFGGIEGHKEAVRDLDAPAGLALQVLSIARDVVFAARRLRRAPLFTSFAVLSLALGVALPTTVYALLRSTIWAESSIENPSELLVFTARSPNLRSGIPQWRAAFSLPDIHDYASAQRSLSAVAWEWSTNGTIAIGHEGASAVAVAVSGAFFDVLRARPSAGRLIGRDDDRPGAPPVVVVSHHVWRMNLGGNPNVLGSVLHVGGRPFTIVGVMRETFRDLQFDGPTRPKIWIPVSAAAAIVPDGSRWSRRDYRSFTLIGRLNPDASPGRAMEEVGALGRSLDREAPLPAAAQGDTAGRVERGWSGTDYQSLRTQALGRASTMGYVLIAIAGLVLVVACSNLANLSLARGTGRQQELAVRRALGATRTRLVRELVAESGLIAVVGLGAAVLLLRVLFVFCTIDLPVSNQNIIAITPVLDGHVLRFTLGAVVLALAMFGLEPAMQLTRVSMRERLAEGTVSILPGGRRHRMLIRLQVAAAFTLLVGASVAVNYSFRLAEDDSGIGLDRLAIGTIVFPPDPSPELEKRVSIEAVLAHLRSMPHVERADAASGMPFGLITTPIARVSSPERRTGAASVMFELGSTPGYLDTIGVSLERGRGFEPADTADARPVAILSAAAARVLFGATDVLGRTITSEGIFFKGVATRVVVGVAADTDVQYRGSRTSELIYVPLAQVSSRAFTIAVRSSDPEAASRAIRLAVSRVLPTLAAAGVGPAAPMLAPGLAVARVAATATLVLGLTALGLAMVGLHGILAYLLSMRTREMALRLALGADRRRIWWMSIREGLRPVAGGLVMGLVIGGLIRMTATSALGLRIPGFDAAIFVVVPALFVTVAIAACALPAWRASRVDPIVALRAT